MHLLKYEEWQGAGNTWYCNDLKELSGLAGFWWIPARMLNISPAEYVELLITKFKPDRIKYYQEQDVLIYSWKNINDCRKFKNWLNAEARKRNFII